MNMLVQVLRVSGTGTVEPCVTLVQEGFKLLANFFMSQINSWEESWKWLRREKNHQEVVNTAHITIQQDCHTDLI